MAISCEAPAQTRQLEVQQADGSARANQGHALSGLDGDPRLPMHDRNQRLENSRLGV